MVFNTVKTGLLVCLTLISTRALSAPIVINDAFILSQTSYVGVGSSFGTDPSTSYGSRRAIGALAGTLAQAAASYVDTGAGALFDYDFSHLRGGTKGSYALTTSNSAFGGPLLFTAYEDVSYDLSGVYSLEGLGQIEFTVILKDITTNATLFADQTRSTATRDDTLTLGTVGDGDATDFQQGSLSGHLTAGHDYRFEWTYFIQSVTDDSGASAMGSLTLDIGRDAVQGAPGNAIPLPGSVYLFMLGLGIGLSLQRRARLLS